MMRLVVSTVLTILGNAIGIYAARLLLPDFHINGAAFITSVLFFTVAQIIFGPLLMKISIKHMPVLRGGVALIIIFVVLVLTVMFTSGLQINGISTWIISPLIIWVATVLAGIVLPMFMFKKVLQGRADGVVRPESLLQTAAQDLGVVSAEPAASPAAAAEKTVHGEIEKWAEMRDKGLISEEEYAAKKKQLMDI